MKLPSDRTLQQDMPELLPYLRPGLSVLDVGSGFGTISLDVADAVRPGVVVAIDPDESRVQASREWVARRGSPDNVTFQVGDAHRLDFPDGEFDLVYSHTVIHFLLDPLTALKEQARVTNSGGWVVAAGVRELIDSVRNPPCPNWDRVLEARRLYSERLLDDFRLSGLNATEYFRQKLATHLTHQVYIDVHAGRQIAGWLTDAGLTDLRLEVKPEHIQYHGSSYMVPSVRDLVPARDPKTPTERDIALATQEMMDAGLLHAATVDKARDEIEAWYQDKHSFHFTILVSAAGRVP